MILQDILLPSVETCTINEMYFRIFGRSSDRINSDYDYENRCIVIEKGSTVGFDTFFNGFSLNKWRKYTIIQTLSLSITCSGLVRISVYRKNLNVPEIRTVCDSVTTFDFGNLGTHCIIIPIDQDATMVSFDIQALSDNVKFYGGNYSTPCEALNHVNLLYNVCTFKREKYVLATINKLRTNIINNPNSPLFQKLTIMVSDNGNTLPAEDLTKDHVFIFPNENLGGVGGFTRNLVEALDIQDTARFSHNIFMDDDVAIDYHTLEKLYAFLSLLKPEYKDATIGGSMLRMDVPNIQHENGCCWKGGIPDGRELVSRKNGLDLTHLYDVLFNDLEEYTEYNAWWFCCMPFSVIRKDNLPLPLFIHCDDVEYGLRNSRILINMNGICVWHESFENKYSPSMDYYDQRNGLITNALWRYKENNWFSDKEAKKEKSRVKRCLIKRVVKNALLYRYVENELLLQGTKDYLKGIDFLINTDAATLHKEIMEKCYKLCDVSSLPIAFSANEYLENCTYHERKSILWKRRLTANGFFFQANHNTVVPMIQPHLYCFYRTQNCINYNRASNKAFITKRDRMRTIQNIMDAIKVCFEIDRKYDRISEEYRNRISEITNIDFWRRYLKI